MSGPATVASGVSAVALNAFPHKSMVVTGASQRHAGYAVHATNDNTE